MVGNIAANRFSVSEINDVVMNDRRFAETGHTKSLNGGGGWLPRGGTRFPRRPVGGGGFSLDSPFHRTTPSAPISRRLRSISLVASTPPEPGGEFARL
jgi:hypothetical protein